MSEARDGTGARWRMDTVILVGGIFLLLGAAWTWLPEIAALGLRFEPTREKSKLILIWLGPRGIGRIFQQRGRFRDAEFWSVTEPICRQAEENAVARRAFMKSLKDPNTNGPHAISVLHSVSALGCVRLAEALIAGGADVNSVDVRGWTPLHLAIRNGWSEVVELLVTHGADVQTKDHFGSTVLHWAAACDQPEIARLLISKGAKVDAADDAGATPLHCAVAGGASHGFMERFDWGRSAGFTVFGKEWAERTRSLTSLLISAGADVNAKCIGGYTALHLNCATMDKPGVWDLLISAGADVNARDDKGRSPLYYAEMQGRNHIVESLVEAGARQQTAGEMPGELLRALDEDQGPPDSEQAEKDVGAERASEKRAGVADGEEAGGAAERGRQIHLDEP